MTKGPSHQEVLSALFGPQVAVACATEDDVNRVGWPASQLRQREFATGRECAARALAQLGADEKLVGRGADGEPLWPQGYVGSISRAEGVCAAVAASANDILAIGFDVERDVQETTSFAHRVCSASEARAIRELGAPVEALALVVLAAKEAVQKLQFPLTRDVIGLRRVEVLLSCDGFTARFQTALPPFPLGATLRGRWLKSAGLIWTGAFLPAGRADFGLP